MVHSQLVLWNCSMNSLSNNQKGTMIIFYFIKKIYHEIFNDINEYICNEFVYLEIYIYNFCKRL